VAPLNPVDAVRLRAEIARELEALTHVLGEITSRRSVRDDTTMYALALLLQNYYTGAERIFQRIAQHLGGAPPSGARWHLELLDDMALQLPDVRPAVISRVTHKALSRLLRLRHILRNLYAWTLRREELDPHIDELPSAHDALVADLARFMEFLSALAAS
jgi:HepT-like protein